jgi:ribosomal protein S18 acetylase RimI-like enzyme
VSDAPRSGAAEFEIVEVGVEHFDEVRAVWEAVGFWPHVGEDRPWFLGAVARNPGLFLAARVKGRMVGVICGGWDGLRGWLYHFGVLPEFRQRGIGDALLGEVERRLRAAGARQVNLLVMEDNAAAMEFYRRRGYARGNCAFFRKRFAADQPG